MTVNVNRAFFISPGATACRDCNHPRPAGAPDSASDVSGTSNLPGSSSASSYSVTVELAAHGEVIPNRHTAWRGNTVTLTVHAVFREIADGYENCPRDSSCPIHPFTDADPNAWYHDGVHYCLENGLMNGSSGVFCPDALLTRAQLVQILHNREGRPVVNEPLQYSDVATGAWYTEALRWATGQGIVSGYGNGQFGPGDNITREQLAVMLWRCAGSPAAADQELHFTDADRAGGYALEALRWAVEKGVINGYGGGQLAPQGLVTRAQAAQMLMNFPKNG